MYACNSVNPGIEVQTPDGTMTSRSMILMCTADLPAKAKVANSLQYNGYFGCNTCTIPGKYYGRSMTWQYDPSAVLRTHDSIISNAENAIKNCNPVCIHNGHCYATLMLISFIPIGVWNQRSTSACNA